MKIFTEFKKLFTRGEKTLLQKQVRLGIILTSIMIVGLIVYFAFVAPVVSQKVNYVPDLFDGEALNQGDTILMVPLRTRDQVKSIEIKSSTETYTIIAKDPGQQFTTFYIEGSEKVELDPNSVSSVVVHSLMLVTNSPKLGSQDRVNEKATAEDMKAYGLDDESNPVVVNVNLLNEKESYTIKIGKMAPMKDGYYAIIDGRKNVVTDENGKTQEYDIVYSLTNYVSNDFVNQTSASLVQLFVFPYLSSNVYQPSDLVISKYNKNHSAYETVIHVATQFGADGNVVSSGQVYKLLEPDNYTLDDTILTSKVMALFEYLKAKEVLAYGPSVHDEKVYSQYGLDLDSERLEAGTDECVAKITFHVKDTTGRDAFEEGDYTVYFGKVYYDASGVVYRYAYTPYSETIFTVAHEDFAFVDWKYDNYISPRIYYENITSLDYLELIDKNTDIRYEMTGNYITHHVDVTYASDTSKKILRDGKPLTFDVEVVYKQAGSYIQTEFKGEFENFRKLYYVLITREYSIGVNEEFKVATEPSRLINIQVTDRDTNQSFYRYDKYGNRIYDENGKLVSAIYEGGFIKCQNIKLHTKGLNGEQTVLEYPEAYYDIEKGKYFLKEMDRADGNYKPANYQIDKNGHISSWSYLSGEIEAEYTVRQFSYMIYDIYYDYTDANGVTTQKINPTYCSVVTKTVESKYKINIDGTTELIETVEKITDVSKPMTMRISQVDKLFNDSAKLIAGIEIDKFGSN
ncbi:MAG: DUF4340 domain-containing protein [Clostridia bacterium]|nr:DUF4340 domain-containing protein [Clostridia bacterium]